MQVYYCTSTLVILGAILVILPSSFAGNKDHDTQLGQVPVKDSPVRSLNNLTVTAVDVSKNKGCHGDNCNSAKNSEKTYYGGGSGGREYRGYEVEDDDDVCDEARDYGDCDGRRMRWYFSALDGLCRRFVYSGCGGNGNNFRSRRRCETECNYYFDEGREL